MIEVKSLVKNFGDLCAVDNVSFNANKGEVLGILGPNGAGKSTTMKIITGFLEPSVGTVVIAGHDIRLHTQKAQSMMGYLSENAPLYEDMYVKEFLQFVAQMRQIFSAEANVQNVMSTCALDSVVGQRIETLSKGYKRRVALAQALIHDPQILILDEPTDGLDPNQKHEVRKLIKSLAKEKCVLISTHILEEVEEICDRVLIISRGKILFEGSAELFKSKSAQGKLADVFRAMTTGEQVEGVVL